MAAFVVEISVIFLTLMSLLLALLIGRRWLDERRVTVRDQKRRQVTKLYLASLREDSAPAIPEDFPRELQSEAVSHLLLLVRGAEREKLLALAEEQGLFNRAMTAASSKLPARRAEAIQTLEQFGSDQCKRALEAVMANDTNAEVRFAAAAALARLQALPSARDTISLLQLDQQKSTPLHRVLFRSLATSHSEQLRELLGGSLNSCLRVAIIDALASLGSVDDMDIIRQSVVDPDPDVRAAAIRAVGKIGDYRTASLVIAALDDPVELVRLEAIETAADLGLRKVLPNLEIMLADHSPWVRMRAGDALNKLDPRRAARAA